jgi:hypothetical protein
MREGTVRKNAKFMPAKSDGAFIYPAERNAMVLSSDPVKRVYQVNIS